ELARADNPPFIGAGGGQGTLFKTLDLASVSAAFNPGGIQRALETIEQEQRRLVQFGVSQIELHRATANSRAALKPAVQAAATRSTPALANALLGAANDDKVFSSPATNLALFEPTVKDLQAAQVSEAVKRAFEGQGPLALVVTPEPIEGGEAGVTTLLEASRATPVAAPVEQAALDWPYADFGAVATPASTTEVAAVGATVVTFPNGVRLTVKPTTFKDQQILISVRTGIGEMGLPTDRFTAQSL